MRTRDAEPRPDLRQGVPFHSLPEGKPFLGRVGDADVVIVRRGDRVRPVPPHCTHCPGPRREGLVVGATIRCPLHHACFSLDTGEALRAPALDPVACWRVDRRGDTVLVTDKIETPPRPSAEASSHPASVVIIGGGAPGLAAPGIPPREGVRAPGGGRPPRPHPPPRRP